MHREHEYKHLADSTRMRGCEEQNALLRAQWEILAATYVRLADQSSQITLSPNRLPAAPDASIGRRAVEVEVPNHILAVAPVELLIRLE